MNDRGVYVAVYLLREPLEISVGRLGRFQFAPGIYFYVGSAQKNLDARLERHARKEKPLRWHIDYLSTKADMIGAITVAGTRERECEFAEDLRGTYEMPVPGFGASDCRCGGHLFYTPEL
jgi:sugar fermentation stimulation protein A